MGVRFNPPPGWPHPPQGWRPAPNWAPDPSWPLPPPDWEFWIREDNPSELPIWADDASKTVVSSVPTQQRHQTVPELATSVAPTVEAPFAGDLSQPAQTSSQDRQLAGTLLPSSAPPTRIPHQAGPIDDDGEATVTLPATPLEPSSTPRPENIDPPRPRWLLLAGSAAVLSAAALLAMFALRGSADRLPETAAPSIAVPSAPAVGASVSVLPSAQPSALPSVATSTTSVRTGPVTGKATALLAALPLRPDTAAAPYSRNAFGVGWKDTDANGCDTGNDVMRRDMTDVRLKTGSECVVVGGKLTDPYIGRSQRYGSISGNVAVDFVVPLSDAWNTGAYEWSSTLRTAFMNDPANLVTVRSTTIAKKATRNAADWLPSQVKYRCPYIARQIGIKTAYGLTVSAAEKSAMTRVLASCPDEPIPNGIASPGTQPAATNPTATNPTATNPTVTSSQPAPEAAPSVVDGATPQRSVSTEVDGNRAATQSSAPLSPRRTSSIATVP